MPAKKLNIIQVYSLIIGVLILVLPLIVGHFTNQNYKEKIMENSVIVSGKITGFEKTYKRTDALNFQFEYNGIKYSSGSSTSGKPSDYEEIQKLVINKNFPVLINKSNPNRYSKILIVPEDFEEYGLKFPDSLRWVLQHIER